MNNRSTSKDDTTKGLDTLDKFQSGSNSVLDSLNTFSNTSFSKLGGLPAQTITATAVINTSEAIENLAKLDKALQNSITQMNNWASNANQKTSQASNSFLETTNKVGKTASDILSFSDSLLSVIVNYKTLRGLNMGGSLAKTGGTIASAASATRLLGSVSSAAPWVAVTSVIAGLGKVLYDLISISTLGYRANNRLNESFEEMERNTAKEEIALQRMFKSLQKAKENSPEWLSARDDIYGKYGLDLSMMNLEIENAKDATIAYHQLSSAIQETSRQRAMDKALNAASDTYLKEETPILEDIRKSFIEKYGEAQGLNYFIQLRNSIHRDEKIPKELIPIIESFNKVTTSKVQNDPLEFIENPIRNILTNLHPYRKNLANETAKIQSIYRAVQEGQTASNSQHEIQVLEMLEEEKQALQILEEEKLKKPYTPPFSIPFNTPSPRLSPKNTSDSWQPWNFSFPTQGKQTVPLLPQESSEGITPGTTSMLSDPLIPNDIPTNSIGNALNVPMAANTPAIGNAPGNAKSINVTINKLVDKFEINTSNLPEDLNRMRDLITDTLVHAVNDLNTAIV